MADVEIVEVFSIVNLHTELKCPIEKIISQQMLKCLLGLEIIFVSSNNDVYKHFFFFDSFCFTGLHYGLQMWAYVSQMDDDYCDRNLRLDLVFIATMFTHLFRLFAFLLIFSDFSVSSYFQ